MARLVEVVAHSSVPVMSHCPSMLCAPGSTGPRGTHFPDILGWFPLTSSSPMRTCDVIDHVGVVTGDALLDGPGLVGQGAGVRPRVGRIDAAETPCLPTLLEARLQPTAGSLSPVNCW